MVVSVKKTTPQSTPPLLLAPHLKKDKRGNSLFVFAPILIIICLQKVQRAG
jgi:hypothetical protein